jgi:DNA polymerase III delta prime subunit
MDRFVCIKDKQEQKTKFNDDTELRIKYKPKFIQDLCYTDAFKNTLYFYTKICNFKLLLYGDCGSGKSSIIQCFVNNLKKKEDYDVMFIHGLEDSIFSKFQQTLQSFCNYSYKKRLIVIDDVEYLAENFQFYLKDFLERYPDINVLFTVKDKYKLIGSLQNRLNVIQIIAPEKYKLLVMVRNICKNENINITDDSIKYILKYSGHSIQRIYSYLEKLVYIGKKEYDINKIREYCSVYDSEILELYMKSCIDCNISDALQFVNIYLNNGYNVIDFLEMLFEYVKHDFHNKNSSFRLDLVELLSTYIIQFYIKHEHECELYLFTHEFINQIHGKKFT